MKTNNHDSSEKIRLFLSAVSKEFEKERLEVKEFLEKELNITVYLSENDEKPEKTSEEKLIEEITGCDIFILLLGGKFGSKHPKENISITQWEFETAKELHKPLLPFCKKDVVFEEGQKEFKEKVFDFEEGKDVPYFSSEKELKEKIKEHLIRLMSRCTKVALPVLVDEYKRGKFFVEAYPLKTTGESGGITQNERGLEFMLQIRFYNKDIEHDYDVDNIKTIIWGNKYECHPLYDKKGLITRPPIKISKRSSEIIDGKIIIKSPSDDDLVNKKKSSELHAEFKKLNSNTKSDFFKIDFDVV